MAAATARNDGDWHDRIDENISSVLVGWCFALIVLVAYRICESRRLSVFAILCVALLLVSAALALVSWVFQMGQWAPSLGLSYAFVLLWCVQVQVYFQIVPFRICVLGLARPRVLRAIIFVVIAGINVVMLVLWPASKYRQPSDKIAFWLPRAEKIGYLFLDVALNVLFLVTVKSKLVDIGLKKYGRLITYNLKIIGLSIFCDLLLLVSMWYPKNSRLFIVVHPVVYLNKLVLERAIAGKMVAVSKENIRWTTRISLSAVLKRASQHILKGIDEECAIESNIIDTHAKEGRRGALSLPLGGVLLDKALPGRPLEVAY